MNKDLMILVADENSRLVRSDTELSNCHCPLPLMFNKICTNILIIKTNKKRKH